MKRKPEFFIPYEEMEPEVREAALEVERLRKTGKSRPPPRRATDCKTMEDLCHYIFKLAHLSGSYQMIEANGFIKRWVWVGRDFGDRLVEVVEKIAPRVPNKDRLEELRLVGTCVSEEGVKRLHRIFPHAKLAVYTEEDYSRNWQWSQANYPN